MKRGVLLAAALAVAIVAIGLLAGLLRPERSAAPRLAAPPADTAPAGSSGELLMAHKELRPMPELRFVDAEDRERGLVDFRGRTVLLNLWATWCGPCRREMPSLDRLQVALGGPAFTVLALSIDRGGLAVVKGFYEELGLTHLGIYVDPSGRAATQLGAVGIPTTLLLDPEGREVARHSGALEWDAPDVIAVLRTYLPPRDADGRGAGRAAETQEGNAPAALQRSAAASMPLAPAARD